MTQYHANTPFEYTRATGVTENADIPSLYGADGIDGTAVGDATICTTIEDSEKNYYPAQVQIILDTVSGLTTAPTISVGTNSPNYDNILSALSLDGLLSSAGTYIARAIGVTSTANAIGNGADIKARISVAATATTYDVRVHIFGVHGL